MTTPGQVDLNTLRANIGALNMRDKDFANSLIRQWDTKRSLSATQWEWITKLAEKAMGKPKDVVPAIPVPEPAPRKVDDDEIEIDEAALRAIVKSAVAPQMDAVHKALQVDLNTRADVMTADVLKRAMDLLDQRVPRKVEITVTRGETKTAIEGPNHKQFEHLLKAASVRLPSGHAPGIFLSGEHSSGKTTGCSQLAKAMGLKWYANGAISFAHEMLGFVDAGGKYHRTPFRDAYEHGGVYTFDEVDRSDPTAVLAVNPHLANGHAAFPDGMVKRHPDCIITATGNTWGFGADAQYSGAMKMDAAFLSRFHVRLAWDIDEDLEAAIVGRSAWLDRVQSARRRARAAGLKVLIDTRAAQAGAALMAAGYSLDQAAAMTYLAGLKPDQRRQVEGV